MSKLRTLSLFSGIGGIELGLERAGGFETVGFCEIDKHCHKILSQHWPEVPIFTDVNTLSRKDIPEGVDVITGGFPCTDVSYAGNAKGLFDENGNRTRSGLWKEYARIIDEFRPRFCIIENVGYLRKNGLGIVLADLARIGYDAEWHTITADSAGYPHQRERLFIISYPRGQRFNGNFGEGRFVQADEERSNSPLDSERQECEPEFGEVRKILSRGTFDRIRSSYPDERAHVSSVRRVTNGVPSKLDESKRKQRIKQLGNAVVPRIAEIIGKAIMENLEQK
jgi:DNA (cytosine-5)-methyltransferase 1